MAIPKKLEISLNEGQPIDKKKLATQLKTLEAVGAKVLVDTIRSQIELFDSGRIARGAFAK